MVGDARQLDVVDVAVPVGTDVSRRLMLAERQRVEKKTIYRQKGVFFSYMKKRVQGSGLKHRWSVCVCVT